MLLIQPIGNAYPTFGSTVVKTDFMEKGLNAARKMLNSTTEESRELGVWFSKALKAVENDGKNDIIQFQFKTPSITGFASYGVLVNGLEKIEERWLSRDGLGTRCVLEFIRFAREELGINLKDLILPEDSRIADLTGKLEAEKHKLQDSAKNILDTFSKK